jgi:hypothetical protein
LHYGQRRIVSQGFTGAFSMGEMVSETVFRRTRESRSSRPNSHCSNRRRCGKVEKTNRRSRSPFVVGRFTSRKNLEATAMSIAPDRATIDQCEQTFFATLHDQDD